MTLGLSYLYCAGLTKEEKIQIDRQVYKNRRFLSLMFSPINFDYGIKPVLELDIDNIKIIRNIKKTNSSKSPKN